MRGRYDEPLHLFVDDGHAERIENGERHPNVRLAHERAVDHDEDVGSSARCRQQHGADQLRRRRRTKRDRTAAESAGDDLDRGETVLGLVADLRPELLECIGERPQRTLAHARHAVESVTTLPQSAERRRKADRRARVAAEQVGPVHGQMTAQSGDGCRGTGFVDLHDEAEASQGVDHDLRVVGEEDVGQA